MFRFTMSRNDECERCDEVETYKNKVVKIAAQAVAGIRVLTLKKVKSSVDLTIIFGQVWGWQTQKKVDQHKCCPLYLYSMQNTIVL